MARRPRDPVADRLSRRLDHAADIIPAIRAHLNRQRQHVSILTANGDDTGRGTVHSDPVASTVLELDRINYREGLIDDALASIRIGVNLLDEAVRGATGYRGVVDERAGFADEPICHATDCDQPVSSFVRDDGSIGHRMGGDYGGLCDSHRARARRQIETPGGP